MKKGIIAIISALSIALIVISLTLFNTSGIIAKQSAPPIAEETFPPVKSQTVKYGLVLDSLDVSEHKIERNQTFLSILTALNIPKETAFKIVDKAKPVYNLANVKVGDHYRVYQEKDSEKQLQCLVYEANPLDFIVVKLKDSIEVFKEKIKVDTIRREIGGVITASLSESLDSFNVPSDLSVNLAGIFAWQVDFFRIMQGDYFKVIYEEIAVGGVPIKTGKILAASFGQNGEVYYAFNFNEGGEEKFFNEKGKNVRGAFLKAPLKFYRISSRYSKRRFHPVLHRFKSHLGTDYAAPTGTPIMTVGTGTVIAARYSKFNGNYVKIKHNSTYTTQYLHMSRIAKGMRPGKHVVQGQVIGYVGSTGLATGPHVCYRLWKNGRQVDPRSVKVVQTDPIEKSNQAAFDLVKEEMMGRLAAIKLDTTEALVASRG